ncbi:MFS transporter [Mesorhizobium sp. M3A.F.Ca.ET.174.01.1.1]|nr:MFS transporter [Mesorhizobium sp. M3A.F.Ca.ET.080.04.2.1]PBB88886.1 MFS transporter [Mesorhizobium sp. WSM3876]RWB76824.1 MAG: MFS transporter [Mesorhizobium sp.]TGS70822.1 MFS transporter [Mesorhizobium sp. M3A.F.Ca.ET.201.01.1.1]TGS88705.1 MFS transporter [Mesorhizobium sp. M3A.F.Ca.ET.175.01.1.1]TGT29651.1 MFS transporter [Mesorhizobium sp. M3A.F.Ca.ET.174.01.1.1]TGT64015.1 MFS transporter [Mesorhizobium sp. M00.F.Ca.ET.170.01.1.1]
MPAKKRTTIDNNQGSKPAPLIAIASVIVSMALIAIGNGLMFAYIPVRLGAGGFDPTWAGLIVTGLSAGGLAGCILTGPLVRRVGHARAFMVLSALIALSNAAIGAGPIPLVWIAARALYGFAICGLFIVAQSWLNDALPNAIRGRVMAVFYVAYIGGLGLGYGTLAAIDIQTAAAPLIGIAFTALSILPVGMTRLAQPPAPQAASVALGKAWRISPVGVAGMLAVGGLSMIISGFAPIHATAKGYSQADVALLLSAMPVGTLILQIPLGWLSDRTDRRYVLAGTAALAVVASLLAIGFDGGALMALVVIYLVWDGAAESIYSLSSAHAADRASKDELLALSSSLLFAWSLSGFIVPGIVTALSAVFGTATFIYVGIVIASMFCVFVLWRVMAARRASAPATGGFAPMCAQTPLPVELAFAPDDSTDRPER